MNRPRLISMLQDAKTQGFQDSTKVYDWGMTGQWVRNKQPEPRIERRFTELVIELSRSETICRQFENISYIFGNSVTYVGLDILARWMFSRCRDTSAEEAVCELERFLTSDQFGGRDILVIDGIWVHEPLEMANGISLIPLPRDPDSPQLCTIHDYWSSALMERDDVLRPRTALVCRTDHKKSTNLVGLEADRYKSRRADLVNACRFLTLIGDSCPIPIGSWWQPDEWVPCAHVNGYRVTPSYEIGLPGRDIGILGDNCQRAASLYQEFCELKDEARERLIVVLDHLNRSRRQFLSRVGIAIELGIAAEAFFLYEPGIERKNGITCRLKLNASRFLENDPERRKQVIRKMNLLYECRSLAIHTGRLGDTVKNMPTDTILRDGQDLMALAGQRLLERGDFPIWEEL